MADNGLKKDDDNKKGSILNMSSRIFVANVPPEKITNKQMRERFEKYGRVLDVYIGKSFAFVQFDNAEDADTAIKGESGSFIEENRIECSLARKQPRSVRPPEAGKGDSGAYRGGPSGYGSLGRGRERSPVRGFDDRFEQRRYDDLDRYPLREFRDDPYRRDDPFYRELAEREAFLSNLEKSEDDPPRPPRPRTPEFIRDMERKHLVHRRQLEDNEAYHFERMRVLKEEHTLKMEVLELKKKSLELEIYKQSMDPVNYQQKSFSSIADPRLASSSYTYNSPMSNAPPATSLLPSSQPSGRGMMPLLPPSSASGGSPGVMKSGLYGRDQRQ